MESGGRSGGGRGHVDHVTSPGYLVISVPSTPSVGVHGLSELGVETI